MHKRQKQDPPDGIQPVLLTIPEVAALLNVGRTTVYGFIQREGLPSVTLSGRGKIRVRRSALDHWIQSREKG